MMRESISVRQHSPTTVEAELFTGAHLERSSGPPRLDDTLPAP